MLKELLEVVCLIVFAVLWFWSLAAVQKRLRLHEVKTFLFFVELSPKGLGYIYLLMLWVFLGIVAVFFISQISAGVI